MTRDAICSEANVKSIVDCPDFHLCVGMPGSVSSWSWKFSIRVSRGWLGGAYSACEMAVRCGPQGVVQIEVPEMVDQLEMCFQRVIRCCNEWIALGLLNCKDIVFQDHGSLEQASKHDVS